MDFITTGRINHGIKSKLHIAHTADVYVTVTAENAAGLISVFYSAPVTVDITPPVISELKVHVFVCSLKTVTKYSCLYNYSI